VMSLYIRFVIGSVVFRDWLAGMIFVFSPASAGLLGYTNYWQNRKILSLVPISLTRWN